MREVLRVKSSMFGSVLGSLPARRQHIASEKATMLKSRVTPGATARKIVGGIMMVVVAGGLSVQQTLHDDGVVGKLC